MATWVNPIDSQTDPDAPLTSELGKRWDNNIVAFYELDASAPRLSKSVGVRAGTSHTISGMIAESGILIRGQVTGGANPTSLRISFSTDGISFSSEKTLSGVATDFELIANKIDGSYSFLNFANGTVGTGTIAGSGSNVTHIKIRDAGGNTGTVRIFFERTGLV